LALADGAAYKPSTDTWRPIAAGPAHPGFEPVWTGSQMVMFAKGFAVVYEPARDRWIAACCVGDGTADGGTPVWTGSMALLVGSASSEYGGTTFTPSAWRPRVWSQAPVGGEPPPSTTALAAMIQGRLAYDAADDCFQLRIDSGDLVPVVWPIGTVAADGVIGVTTTGGRTFVEGDEVAGGGGFLKVADQWSIPPACGTGDVAVFNPGDDLAP